MPVATVALLRHGGSHLIRPIVAKLGFDIIEPGNFGAPLDQAVGPVIVFLRDPRNRMVSTLRWWQNRGKVRSSIATLSDDNQMLFLLRNKGFLEEMLIWANMWGTTCIHNKEYLYMTFEHMSIESVGMIAKHLGLRGNKARDTKIFDEVYGKSRTYTGNHSKWDEYFGPLSLEYWNKNGGPDLLDMMGYVDG